MTHSSYISLGLQCSVPQGIKHAGIREISYPFDWLWCPSKTAFSILAILVNNGVEEAVSYMTTGYSYYDYLGNEVYISVPHVTISQINATTGLGNTHYTINNEYKATLTRRLTQLLDKIKSGDPITFIYADAASPTTNYTIDNIVYGLDGTSYLEQIYDLISAINTNIKILYFCWEERHQNDTEKITYISFPYKKDWHEVAEIISSYIK